MILDLIHFDSKKRFYQFYISINLRSFTFAVCIADYDFEFHWGLMKHLDVE